MTSEIGETFAALKELNKKKKLSNKEYSTKLISELFHFESRNNGNHLIVEHECLIADFWPSTGKYNIRGTGDYKRGVKNLIRDLKESEIDTNQ